MAENYEDIAIGKTFVVKDYVELANDAAQRTRWITIVLVIATVIIGIGFYNSTKWSWARYRIDSRFGVENKPVNNVYSPLLDAYFGEADFKPGQLKRFACVEINQQGESSGGKDDSLTLDQYIYRYFNQETRDLLKKECVDLTEKPSKDFVENFNNSLNLILPDRFLYNKKRFESFENNFQPKTRLMLDWALKSSGEKTGCNSSGSNPAGNRTVNRNSNVNVNSGNVSNSGSSIVKTGDEEAKTGPILNIKRADLVKLNRMILEDAYPDYLEPSHDVTPDDDADRARQLALWGGYIDNVQFVEIPVFGIAIDMNDLGLIGGIGLAIILLLMRFSLSREIKNLNISFKQSFYHDQLKEFYHSLAMRQVLTVPQMEGEEQNQALSVGTKFVCLLPMLVLLAGVGYDYYSVIELGYFNLNTVLRFLLLETVCFLFATYFSLRCLERQIHIDEIWDNYYEIIKRKATFNVLSSSAYQKSGDTEMIRIFKYRFKNDPMDKWWFLNLFKGKSLSRLIPNQKLADWIAGGKTEEPKRAEDN